MQSAVNHTQAVFLSDLGWIGLVWQGSLLVGVTLGHPNEAAARRALPIGGREPPELDRNQQDLVARLQRFAVGQPDDFRDIPVQLPALTAFQQAILKRCREIPYGEVFTYGGLAAAAGFPRSARAVGNVMAANRTPIVIPCHRVVAAGRRLGGFSAAGGVALKRVLLQLEQSSDPNAGRAARSSFMPCGEGQYV